MAAVDHELTLRAAKGVADAYGDAVSELLRIVAGRLARGITDPGWAEAKLAETVELRRAAQVLVDRLVNDTPALVGDALDAGWTQGIRDAGDIGAGLATTNTAPLQALTRATVGDLTAMAPRILRTTVDAYRDIIATSTTMTTTGTMTRLQATQRALDRFADRGITGFVDRSGRRWELESYAEMATRTATGRAQVDATLGRLSANGRDLVIVSNAPEECKVCVVPGTVVSGPVPEGACRSEYSGDLITIRTAAGNELSGTPDHTVMTTLGWLPMKALRPGDQVISHLGEQWDPGVMPHHVQVPSLIEDALHSDIPLLLSGPTRRDLDSDVAYREVGVVRPDRDLLAILDPSLVQPFSHLDLVGRVGATSQFACPSDLASRLVGVQLGKGEGLGVVELDEHRLPVLGPPLLHSGADHLGALLMSQARHVLDDGMVAWPSLHASAPEVVTHGPTADAEGGAELLRALSGQVAGDEILSVGVSQFRGHVWDLQTGPRWYWTNRILTHNCRPWEGKVLSISGADRRYPTVKEATSAGLLHANCRHRLTAYIEGVTRPETNTADPEGDRARQEQRRLERGVRQWKRREAAAIDPEAERMAKAKAREWQARLRDHVEANDLKRRPERERIGGAR